MLSHHLFNSMLYLYDYIVDTVNRHKTASVV